MSYLDYVGGQRLSRVSLVPSKFCDSGIGLLIGYDSSGALRKASSCHPMVGLYLGTHNSFGEFYECVQLGVTWFRSSHFLVSDLVIGGYVYADAGKVVSFGVRRIGILSNLTEHYVEVVVC